MTILKPVWPSKSGTIFSLTNSDGFVSVKSNSPHGLVTGDTVVISGTVNYDGTYTNITRLNDLIFEISASYVSDETVGTWSSEDAYFSTIMWQSQYIEVPDSAKEFFRSVRSGIVNNYINEYNGFSNDKYKIGNVTEYQFRINFVGNSPPGFIEHLKRLATSVLGAGLKIEFTDTWNYGTEASAKTFHCRWINAGDFVESNVLASGASMILIAIDVTTETENIVLEFQETINTPVSGLEWTEKINDADASVIYTEIIGERIEEEVLGLVDDGANLGLIDDGANLGLVDEDGII